MSLYSAEEICNECRYAIFHECCNSFCKCKEKHEEDRDHLDGKCLHKNSEKEKMKSLEVK